MEQNWIRIFTSPNYYRSEMIRQALAGHDIHSVVLSKQDSSYKNFGEVEVYVHQNDFSSALEVIILTQVNI